MEISEKLQVVLQSSMEFARVFKNEYVTIEHLLYALIADPAIESMLVYFGVNPAEIRDAVAAHIQATHPIVENGKLDEPKYTLGFEQVLNQAIFQRHSAGRADIDTLHVFAAVFQEPDTFAGYILRKSGLRRVDVLKYMSHSEQPPRPVVELPGDALSDEDPEAGRPEPGKRSVLDEFCINLNAKAAAGKLDPLIGRKEEIQRLIHILSRRRKNNPILVGDAGVGKTALIEGLAQAIVTGESQAMAGAVIYQLNMSGVIAGTRYRGDFEERFKRILKALQDQPFAILFIDEIHTIIGAGAVSSGAMDAANMLKPFLASSDLRCIGTTTYDEYRAIFDKDHALSRRFQKLDLAAPSEADTITILTGLKGYYEAFHGVTYQTEALQAAVHLSERYIRDRFLPDKAIDVLDEAGAELKLNPEVKEDQRVVTVALMEEVVSRLANIPAQSVKVEEGERLKHLSAALKARVFGQEAAIDQIVQAVFLSRAGLTEPDKPIGMFLFSGPTGVGKTEMARQLSQELGIELLRFDMSEYMEKHAVARLIGAPPGYIGYEKGGLLTEAIHRSPHSVLLLDEIEKAHEDIFNILLQIMDHATLTDTNGRKADFRHTLLIMTTNTGARENEQVPIGFEQKWTGDRSGKAIEKMFSPEFRNRLTGIVPFTNLDMRVIIQIVEKLLSELGARLAAKGISFTWSSEAADYLAHTGYDPKFGARPLKRLIESRVSQPISERILFGDLRESGTLHLTCVDDALAFSVLLKK